MADPYPWIFYSSASRSSFGSFYDGSSTESAQPLSSCPAAIETKYTEFGRIHRSAIYVKNAVSGINYEFEAAFIFAADNLPTDELNLDLYNVCDLDLRPLVLDNNNGYSGFYVRVGYNIDGGSDTSKGIYSRSNNSSTMNNLSASYSYTVPPVPIYTDRNQWLAYVRAQDWETVPSVRGKLGTQHLSKVKADALNNGESVTGASGSVIDTLAETTKLSTLAQGLSAETPVLYTDDVNYMSLTPTANNTCTLKFYLDNSVIYTLTGVSTNAYLQFIKDAANEVMKPSIIYKAGQESYLFAPNFYSDGRDTVRYDPNASVIVATDSGDLAHNYPEGALFDDSNENAFIISSGEAYWSNGITCDVAWGFDITKNQAIIDPNSTVTFHIKCKRTGTVTGSYGIQAVTLELCSDDYHVPSLPNDSNYYMNFVPLTRQYAYAGASDSDNETTHFDEFWNDEMNFNANSMTIDTWYDFKFVWQLSGGIISTITYYIDNEQIGTTKNVLSVGVPFINVIGTNRKLSTIDLWIANNMRVKDLYIEYT